MFRSLCDSPSPACVLLTDGRYGSAFFEHRYLSDLLGIPLVEGPDLYVGHDGRVYARTLDGDNAVDLVYRRVEDLELFVPGLREAYQDARGAHHPGESRDVHRPGDAGLLPARGLE